MAGSRLEKIGTIFSRTSGLIQTGALNFEDRPLWYDIYKAFPPKEEPKYDRPIPNMKLKQIFYKEDKIRALFHRNNKQIGAINLFSAGKSITQRFIDTYVTLLEQYKDREEVSEEQLYKEAIDILNKGHQLQRDTALDSETISLSSAYKEARRKMNNINLKDIFQ
ncbi:mitochondrial ribosomal protein S23 [Rhynchophorus ferrugineus]|uniref:Small ribosomal subunit protein mS23 n=1 Tax=Rhynchophorus ferrugineus TaxID=354439 RepID=A0A834IRG1_RHYFE|nr:hypothetical protein GWI33_002165 [Rhynchophorus ferrugineus]